MARRCLCLLQRFISSFLGPLWELKGELRVSGGLVGIGDCIHQGGGSQI